MSQAEPAPTVTVGAGALRRWALDLLCGAGLEPQPAATVADTLMDANLRGVDSHGVLRLPVYVRRLREGLVNGDPNPRVLSQDGAVALVDADQGPGQVAGIYAVDLAVRLAGSHGVGAVSVRRSTHFGAAGYYAVRAARAGFVALCTSNAEPDVVPFGGSRRALGTNPIAFAAPRAGGVFVLDMATSQVAIGKVFLARERRTPIPEGWAVDARGALTTDPHEAVSVLPLGGYKGYGLAVMVEILSGILAGAGSTTSIGRANDEFDRPQDVGHFFLAIDPERTVGRRRLAALVEGLTEELRAIPPAPGFDEVLVPGDAEDRVERVRRRAGIPLPQPLYDRLRELSLELGVATPG